MDVGQALTAAIRGEVSQGVTRRALERLYIWATRFLPHTAIKRTPDIEPSTERRGTVLTNHYDAMGFLVSQEVHS